MVTAGVSDWCGRQSRMAAAESFSMYQLKSMHAGRRRTNDVRVVLNFYYLISHGSPIYSLLLLSMCLIPGFIDPAANDSLSSKSFYKMLFLRGRTYFFSNRIGKILRALSLEGEFRKFVKCRFRYRRSFPGWRLIIWNVFNQLYVRSQNFVETSITINTMVIDWESIISME